MKLWKHCSPVISFLQIVLFLFPALFATENASAQQCYSSGVVGSFECPNLKPGPWAVSACDNSYGGANHEAQWCEAFGGTGGVNCSVPEDYTFANVEPVSLAYSSIYTGCPNTLASDTGWGATVSSEFCWNGSSTYNYNVLETWYRQMSFASNCQANVGIFAAASRGASCYGNMIQGTHCSKYEDNSCTIGNPVQLWNLQYFVSETDIPPISGGLLTYSRHYRSQGHFYPAEGPPLGYQPFPGNWEDNFDIHLYALDPATYPVPYMISNPNGQVRYFTTTGTEWVHYAGYTADTLQIVRDGNGKVLNYVRTTTDDLRQTFSPDGRLIGEADRNGHQLTLGYDAANYLISVTDERGRTLTFTRGVDELIQTIADPSGNVIGYTYFPNNNLESVVYPASGSRVYSYGDSNWPLGLTDIQDENGAAYEHTDYYAGAPYVTENRLAPNLASGTIEHYSLDFTSSTVTVTEPLQQGGGTPTTYNFAITNQNVVNMGSVSQPCSKGCGGATVQSRTYDTAGFPQTESDFNGDVTNFTFDDTRGLETQRVGASGTSSQRTTNTSWNSTFREPNQRSILNASGVAETTTTWTYNVRGQVTARCDVDPAVSAAVSYTCGSATNAPTGVRQWSYIYCDTTGTGCPLVGLLKSARGPRTDVADLTAYSYYATTDNSGCATAGGSCHAIGDLQTVTNALSQITTYVTYDKNGHVTRLKDANGTLTDLTYHPRGWLLTRTVRYNSSGSPSSSDATTIFAYDNVGNVKQVTQADGSYFAYSYDDAHRLTDIQDNLSNHVHYTLDAAGNRTEEQTYDPSNTLKRSLGRQYDQLNKLTAVLNASSNPIQSFTNPADAPPTGTTYRDGYDLNGNPIYSIDGTSSHVGTEKLYDPLNRLIKTLQDHAGSGATRDTQTRYAYDARDNLRSVTDPDNLVTNYTYDGLNNLTSVSSPDSGNTGFSYDAAGNRKSQTDARSITTSYTYDAINRVTGITYPTTSLNVTYAYDQSNAITGCSTSYPIGRLTKMTDSSGSTTYCYDRRGNVLKKTQVTNGVTLATTYTYTLGDRIATISYPSTAVVTYTRNTLGQITNITYKPTPTGTAVTLVSSATYYPYGPLNVLTFGNGRTLTKTYDQNYAIDKVVSSVSSGLIVDATVDVLGNVINASSSVGANPPTQQYVYDPLYRLTTVENGSGTSLISFAYEATGDRTSKTPQGQGAQSYVYAPGTHHLTTVAGVSRSVDANGNTTSLNGQTLTYDNRNRLSAVGTETYNYNGKGERVSKSSPATLFVYAENGSLLGEYSSTGAVQREYISLDTLMVGAATGSQIYYVETDQLGTPRQVIQPGSTPSNDVQVWKWDYFASNSAFGENTPNPQTISFALRFPGQYYDQETGLNYNYFRDYEPGTGRYIEADPITLRGLNLYFYADGNPSINIDPIGLMPNARDWFDCIMKNKGDGFVCNHYISETATASMVQPYNQLCKDVVKTASCSATCGLKYFIGEDVLHIVEDAHLKAIEQALERIAEETASKALERLLVAYSAGEFYWAAGNTVHCTWQCSKGG